MLDTQPLDDVLNSKAKLRVLRYLSTVGGEHTGREIARAIGMGETPTNRALRDLADMLIVLYRVAGRSHRYRLNEQHALVGQALRPLFSAEQAQRDAVVAEILTDVGGPLDDVAPAEVLDGRLLHLTATERAALTAFVNRLRQRYDDDVLHVTLFGSKARGDFDDESDLDLLVVVRMEDGDYRKYWNEIVDIAWDIELAYGVVTSLVIKDEVGYAKMRDHQLLLARNIERDGIELWTRQPSVSTSRAA